MPSGVAAWHGSRVYGFIRDWAYPAAVIALWVAAAGFTASQLVSVESTLREIPDGSKAARAARQPGRAARR